MNFCAATVSFWTIQMLIPMCLAVIMAVQMYSINNVFYVILQLAVKDQELYLTFLF